MIKSRKGSQRLYDRNWHLLSTSKSRCHDGEQWKKILQIRNKLKEYCTAPRRIRDKNIDTDSDVDESTARLHTILNLPGTRWRDVVMLRDWIARPDLGGGIPFSGKDLYLGGTRVYDDACENDLMLLKNWAGENDHFDKFLAGPVFHGCEKVLRFFKVSVPDAVENVRQVLTNRAGSCPPGSRKPRAAEQPFSVFRCSCCRFHRCVWDGDSIYDTADFNHHPILCTRSRSSTWRTLCLHLLIFDDLGCCDKGSKN